MHPTFYFQCVGRMRQSKLDTERESADLVYVNKLYSGYHNTDLRTPNQRFYEFVPEP